MPEAHGPDLPSRLETTAYFEQRQAEMISAIERIVSIESPSSDAEALEQCAAQVALYFREMTGIDPVRHHDNSDQLPHLQLDLGERPDVLMIGHFDTVHPIGTLKRSPCRVDGDRLYGPGVLDMKSGVVLMAEVARFVLSLNARPNIRIILNSDEETGSLSSWKILRQGAVGAKAVFVFESTFAEGILKTGARGVREVRVTAKGKGGHAGYPEHYINPVNAIGDVIVGARKFHDPDGGLVVSATMLEGSTATNAVPESASVHFSIRGESEHLLDMAEEQIRAIQAFDERVQVDFETISSVPTFEIRADNYALALAKRAAKLLGLVEPVGIEARGASDANQIAAIAPEAIEGLGGWGEGLHDPDNEYINISSLAPSAALASIMTLMALSDPPLANGATTQDATGSLRV